MLKQKGWARLLAGMLLVLSLAACSDDKKGQRQIEAPRVRVEQVVRDNGAVPATMAIIGGKLKVGLSEADLKVMCEAHDVGKVSRRDVPVYIASGRTGATTVATTMG